MNLRKLLSGLLALCLLLTMAPVALMEEAAPEEVVIDLGEDEIVEEVELVSDEVEANDYIAVGDWGDDPKKLPSDWGDMNNGVEVEIGKPVTITADSGMYFVSVKNKKSSVATGAIKGTTNLELTANKAGTALVEVKMDGITFDAPRTFIITVKALDPAKFTKLSLRVVGDSKDCNDKTKTYDVYDDGAFYVTATPNSSTAKIKKINWESSDSKIAKVEVKKNPTTGYVDGTYAKVTPLKKGKVTITARSGSVSAKFTLKLTNNYKPTSVKAYTDVSKNELIYDGTVTKSGTPNPKGAASADRLHCNVYSVVKPAATPEPEVTYTLENTTYAAFWDTDAKDWSKKATTDDTDKSVRLYYRKAGSVKLTAKIGDKKHTITVKTIDNTVPGSIDFENLDGEEYYNKEKVTVQLYNENTTTDPEKPKKNAIYLVPTLYDKNDPKVWINPALTNSKGALVNKTEYANIKWTSSNKKVATVEIVKTASGYKGDFRAKVSIKDTGTTDIKATTKDGKNSFLIKLKVVNDHACKEIKLINKSYAKKLPVGEVIDLSEYFEIVSNDEFYGKVTISKRHSTSKFDILDGTLIRTNKKGSGSIKIKTSDGKSKTLEIKIK